MFRPIGMLAAMALAATPLAARASAASCKFQQLAAMPVTMEGLRPIVAGKINGHDATFILDTGAFFSGVSDEAAERFGMKKTVAPFGMTLKSVGGSTHDAHAVEAETFEIANGHFRHTQFLVGGRTGDGAYAGLLGQNLLANYDMEYDLANGMVRFFKATDCAGANLAYWSAGKSVSRIDLETGEQRYLMHVTSRAKVDGHSISVTFDSGSPVSFLNRAAASRAGVTIATDGAVADGVVHGIYGSGMDTFLAPFASFAIGDEEIRNTRLRVAKIDLGESDMLLGADFFLSHRILVSKSQNKIYFTYNGGPVFRLDRNPGARVAETEPEGPAVAGPAKTAEPAPDAPRTAADYLRRGQAAAARRDFAQAIADFGKAIELDPQGAPAYEARAMARLGAGQPVLAMADLDETLRRQPANARALMTRGMLYLMAKDPARARTDFDGAMKLEPENGALLIQAAHAYAGAGRFEPALQMLDAWLESHPKSERAPQVLTTRCWVRAAAGKDLPAALADCDAALRRDRASNVLETRGLVLLRLGRTDEALAQFAEAVRLQPRSAEALYGRGLANLAKGAKAAGEADIAAAVAINPGLAEEYKRFGLAPAAGPATSAGKS